MKKFYAILVVLLMAPGLFAQTYLSEDFSGGTFPPPGWANLPVSGQWMSNNSSYAGGIAPEARFETFNYTGTVRLISPIIDLTDVDTVMLTFKHFYDNASGPGPKCGVSTRSDFGAWNNVWEENPTATIGPEEISVLITNDDTGSDKFQITFYLDGNMSGINNWYLDDIEVFAPPTMDAKMTAVLTPAQIQAPAPVEGRITNLGATEITELSVSWKSYAGVVRDSTFSGLTLASMEAFDFEFDGTWASPYGTHNLEMWINSVNGGLDENQLNDSIYKPIDYISYTFNNRPTLEEFTSSTCGPCASFNSSFVPWCNNHADDITLIKYQMNWPGAGDPYYTAEGGVRRTYYGVNGVPDLFGNGGDVATSVGAVQAFFDQAIQQEIAMTMVSSFTMNGTIIDVTTTILPFQSFSTLKVYNVVFEKLTTGNVATNGETEFEHVMMKMLPNAQGESVTFQSGVPVTLEYSYDMATTHVEEFDDLQIGIMVQDPSTKEIYQSGYGYDGVVYSDESRLSMIYLDGEPLEGFDPNTFEYTVELPQGTIEEPVMTVEPMDDNAMPIVSMAFAIPGTAVAEIIAENLVSKSIYEVNYEFSSVGIGDEPQASVNVFPNPANDHLFITGLENARLAIHSVDGKLVLLKEGFSGNSIDISNLQRGIYIINIMMDNKQVVRKKIAVM